MALIHAWFVGPKPKLFSLFCRSDHAFFFSGEVSTTDKFSVMLYPCLPRFFCSFTARMRNAVMGASLSIFDAFFGRTYTQVFSPIVKLISIYVIAIIECFKWTVNHSKNDYPVGQNIRGALRSEKESPSGIAIFQARPPILRKVGIFFGEDWLRSQWISFWHKKGRTFERHGLQPACADSSLAGNWLSCARTPD